MDDTPILVIGTGNEYRNDDAIGLLVVRSLKKMRLPRTMIIEISGDSLNLINDWKDAKAAILVDAVYSRSEPGTIFRYNGLIESIPMLICFHSTHVCGIAETIELGRMLHQLPPNLLLFGIEGKNFDNGTNISPEVENAIPQVIGEIMQVIQDFLRDI